MPNTCTPTQVVELFDETFGQLSIKNPDANRNYKAIHRRTIPPGEKPGMLPNAGFPVGGLEFLLIPKDKGMNTRIGLAIQYGVPCQAPRSYLVEELFQSSAPYGRLYCQVGDKAIGFDLDLITGAVSQSVSSDATRRMPSDGLLTRAWSLQGMKIPAFFNTLRDDLLQTNNLFEYWAR